MEIEFIELTQHHVEAFVEPLPEGKSSKVAVYNGAVVRSAVKAGWLVKPKIDNVDVMKPGEVRKLAEAILAEYQRVTTLDPS